MAYITELVAMHTCTMKEEEIEIGNCSSCRPKDGDEEHYQTNIIATRRLWIENLETNYALEQPPNVGQAYFVFLNQPVKFSLNMKFWLFYDCPKAFYDGYEKEEEIEQARFCFGQITKIISYARVQRHRSHKRILRPRLERPDAARRYRHA